MPAKISWKKTAFALDILTVMAILVAGLFPFDFFPENGAKLIKEGNALEFNGKGIAYTDVSERLGGFFNGPGITIEILLESGETPRVRHSTILELVDGEGVHRFSIAQWYSNLLLRRFGPDGSFEDAVRRGSLSEGKGPAHLVITSGPEGTAIYLNGEKTDYKGFRLFDGCGGECGIVLGNSYYGYNPWKGMLLKVALYDSALSSEEVMSRSLYVTGAGSVPSGSLLTFFKSNKHSGAYEALSPEEWQGLTIPVAFKPPQRKIIYFSQGVLNTRDLIINILGFLPLGFFTAAFLSWGKKTGALRTSVFAVLFGFILSLSVEMLQILEPERYPSLADLLANTAGSALGTFLFAVFHRFRPESRAFGNFVIKR